MEKSEIFSDDEEAEISAVFIPKLLQLPLHFAQGFIHEKMIKSPFLQQLNFYEIWKMNRLQSSGLKAEKYEF